MVWKCRRWPLRLHEAYIKSKEDAVGHRQRFEEELSKQRLLLHKKLIGSRKSLKYSVTMALHTGSDRKKLKQRSRISSHGSTRQPRRRSSFEEDATFWGSSWRVLVQTLSRRFGAALFLIESSGSMSVHGVETIRNGKTGHFLCYAQVMLLNIFVEAGEICIA